VAEELKREYREDLTLFEGPKSRNLAILAVIAVVAYVLVGGSGSVASLGTELSLYVIAALGLNLLLGYTGQISLGHAAFLAIGAYTHVILYSKGAPFAVSVFAGAAVAGVFGFIVGIPALRLKGPYLAIATLGFQVTVDQVLGSWESVTGGRMGLGVPKPDFFGVIVPAHGVAYFLICFALAIAVGVGVYNLGRSRVGRAFVAIRDNEVAAESMGISIAGYKTLAFAMSAFATGLAGALLAQMSDRLNPRNFELILSIELLVIVIIGGLGSVLGTVLGAAVYLTLEHGLSDYPEYKSIIMGVVLIAILLFEPMGIRGRWLRVKYYFKAWPF
jgi:branched-chain amino acid transport system permease protein